MLLSAKNIFLRKKKGYLQVALLLGKLPCHKLDIHLIPFQRSLQKQHKSHPPLRPFLRTQTCFEDKNRRCCSSKHLFETAFYYSDFKQKAEVIHNCIATRQTNKQGKPCVNSHCVVSIWYAVGRKCLRKKYDLPSKETILTSCIDCTFEPPIKTALLFWPIRLVLIVHINVAIKRTIH